MSDLSKLVLLGAILLIVGILAAVSSWRHRGEWEGNDISNMLVGLIGVAAMAFGICVLVPPVLTALDGGPWS